MRLSISKTKVITFTETMTALYRACKLHDSCIKLTCVVKERWLQTDWKLLFH